MGEIYEGQLRRWCGGAPSEKVSEHFVVIRIYTEEHDYVDFLQDDQVYRGVHLADLLQLSAPAT